MRGSKQPSGVARGRPIRRLRLQGTTKVALSMRLGRIRRHISWDAHTIILIEVISTRALAGARYSVVVMGEVLIRMCTHGAQVDRFACCHVSQESKHACSFVKSKHKFLLFF